MLQLQRNVPPPVRTRERHGNQKYPFATMQVGDFFFVPNKETNSLRTYFSTAGKAHGIKLTSRLIHARQEDDGKWQECPADAPRAVQGVGVWRIE